MMPDRQYGRITFHHQRERVAGRANFISTNSGQEIEERLEKRYFKLLQAIHHAEIIERSIKSQTFPVGMLRQVNKLTAFIKPSSPNADTTAKVKLNTDEWMRANMIILKEHYDHVIALGLQNLPPFEQIALDKAIAYGKTRYKHRLKISSIQTLAEMTRGGGTDLESSLQGVCLDPNRDPEQWPELRQVTEITGEGGLSSDPSTTLTLDPVLRNTRSEERTSRLRRRKKSTSLKSGDPVVRHNQDFRGNLTSNPSPGPHSDLNLNLDSSRDLESNSSNHCNTDPLINPNLALCTDPNLNPSVDVNLNPPSDPNSYAGPKPHLDSNSNLDPHSKPNQNQMMCLQSYSNEEGSVETYPENTSGGKTVVHSILVHTEPGVDKNISFQTRFDLQLEDEPDLDEVDLQEREAESNVGQFTLDLSTVPREIGVVGSGRQIGGDGPVLETVMAQDSEEMELASTGMGQIAVNQGESPLRKKRATRHRTTFHKFVHWRVKITEPVVIIGDSNLSRIGDFNYPLVQVDSFPGAQILHIKSILENVAPCRKVQKVVLSVGLVNGHKQNKLLTVQKQFGQLMTQAQVTFPRADIFIPLINFSRHLPLRVQNLLKEVNLFLEKNFRTLKGLEPEQFQVEATDPIHWTEYTAKKILDSWILQLN